MGWVCLENNQMTDDNSFLPNIAKIVLQTEIQKIQYQIVFDIPFLTNEDLMIEKLVAEGCT